MKKSIIRYFGLIIVFCFIVAVSGCIYPNTSNVDPKTDLVVDNEPIEFQENGPPGEWFVTANYHSKSDTDYDQVTYNITMYDGQGNIIGSAIGTENDVDANYGGLVDIVIKNVKGNPTKATFTVVNATVSSK